MSPTFHNCRQPIIQPRRQLDRCVNRWQWNGCNSRGPTPSVLGISTRRSAISYRLKRRISGETKSRWVERESPLSWLAHICIWLAMPVRTPLARTLSATADTARCNTNFQECKHLPLLRWLRCCLPQSIQGAVASDVLHSTFELDSRLRFAMCPSSTEPTLTQFRIIGILTILRCKGCAFSCLPEL